jgi:hypothetical protein
VPTFSLQADLQTSTVNLHRLANKKYALLEFGMREIRFPLPAKNSKLHCNGIAMHKRFIYRRW